MATSPGTNHPTSLSAIYDDGGNVVQIQPPGQLIIYQYKYDPLNAMQEAKAVNVSGETRQL